MPQKVAIRRATLKGARAVALLAVVLAAVGPFFYVVSVSFHNSLNLFTYPPQWLPHPWTILNYKTVINDYPFLHWVYNTLFVATTVTVIKVVIDSMGGYALAKMDFAGRKLVLYLTILTLMVPQALLIIPLFFVVRDVGIFNTYWALILPPLANPIGLLMMRSFIQRLPRDIENAARIDNCNHFRIYWHIVLPVVKPGLVVVATYTFLLQYSSLVWPLVGTSSPSLQLLTVGLATMTPNSGTATVPYGVIAAGSVLATGVIAGVFLILQRHFSPASFVGALKG